MKMMMSHRCHGCNVLNSSAIYAGSYSLSKMFFMVILCLHNAVCYNYVLAYLRFILVMLLNLHYLSV